jgi:NADPH:quinone reductase-like Zn-dependent oxidoreductase
MRALVYTRERTLDVLDVETPVPDAGEVLIRVERVGFVKASLAPGGRQ